MLVIPGFSILDNFEFSQHDVNILGTADPECNSWTRPHLAEATTDGPHRLTPPPPPSPPSTPPTFVCGRSAIWMLSITICPENKLPVFFFTRCTSDMGDPFLVIYKKPYPTNSSYMDIISTAAKHATGPNFFWGSRNFQVIGFVGELHQNTG